MPPSSRPGIEGKKRVAVPTWLLVVSVVTLLGFLSLMIVAVKVAIGGDLSLSNDLAAASLLVMAVFAVVNLSQQQRLARTAAPV